MTQIKRKFIEDNAINGAKIRLDNNEGLKARNASNTSDITLLRLNSSNILEVVQQPRAESSLPLPSANKDYVTVEYVNNLISGKNDPKEAVDLLSDAQLALTGSVPLVIDGVTVANGDEVALINQTTASANGVYSVAISGGTYTMTRRWDFDTDAEVTKGAYFPIISGTKYAGYQVILTTDNPITVGTTDLAFVAYPSAISIAAGDMLTRNGNTLSVELAPISGLESTNPGMDNGQLRLKTDTQSLEQNKSTRLDTGTGAVVAKVSKIKKVTLVSGDVTNQYIDLDHVAETDSIQLNVAGGGSQIFGDDFTVNYTGGTGSKTRVSFAGGLATGGVSALVVGDVVVITYRAF